VHGDGPFRDVVIGSLPFVLMMVFMMFLLLALAQMALWLPSVFN
jgi:C4-dicarboxylate transporter, DctM subunit